MMRIGRLLGALAICASFWSAASAASARNDGATLIVNEVPVFTLRASVAGYGPSERAQLVAKRIAACAEPIKIGASKSAGAWVLTAAEGTLMQVDPSDATANGTSLPALATQWQQAIQKAIDLPALKLERRGVRLQVGQATAIGLTGSQASEATASSSNENAVKVERSFGQVKVLAVGKGTATVTVMGRDASTTIEVKCLAPAAVFPKVASVEVVGLPASSEIVRDAIRGAIATRTQGEAGMQLKFTSIPSPEVAPGQAKTVRVKVKAGAPDAFDVDDSVEVVVRNLAIRREPEAEFWYCNNPESVKKPQDLFRAPLRANTPVRMLYHNLNASAMPFYYRVDILNPSDLPAKVVIIGGDSKPDKNPVLAGLMAAEPFLKNWLTGSGEVVTIPPKTSIPLCFHRLAPGDTASGLCYLRLLSDGPAELPVTAEAVTPYGLDNRLVAADPSATPWREVAPVALAEPADGPISEYVYGKPFRDAEVTYRVGGNFGFLQLGMNPIARKTPGRGLDGNFGVTYNIAARAENPSDKPASIEVVFEASAGYSGGLFIVDGDFRTIRPIQPKAEVQLASFKLQPGESREVKITTIPLSGSCYPAMVAVRPVHALPIVGG